jgi:hypothetical protein
MSASSNIPLSPAPESVRQGESFCGVNGDKPFVWICWIFGHRRMVNEFGGGMDRLICPRCNASITTRWYGYDGSPDQFPSGIDIWKRQMIAADRGVEIAGVMERNLRLSNALKPHETSWPTEANP